MSDPIRKRAERIRDHASELEPAEREAFLDASCADDEELRREVEGSLGEDESLDETLPPSAPKLTLGRGPVATPERLGRFRLLRRIGEGGMGEVWLARQEEPIRRQVAIKLIKSGLATKEIIARFQSERQALALMDHPNIARVFDAGSGDDGRPYFVMEYVQGEPITSYCDRHNLTTEERLQLVVQVCAGVQHAHQKAVIHRDLKPSNVLVTAVGGEPIPKIIDFGVAKATGQRLTEQTLFTEIGQVVGTPEYMSPEQADQMGDAIDTRTDIYSLGVLLYELLVGVLPFDPEELRKAGFGEVLRKIREDDPPRPSTRLSHLGQVSTTAARNRRTTLGKLNGQLRGDLDWVTMKALDKDRTRRYASPSELAADIERFLRNEPVMAGPPSASYRARKFVRRHRGGVAFAAIVAVLLVGVSVTTALQARRIAVERDRANAEARTARRVSELLVGLFEASNPTEAQGEDVTARELLDRGARRVEELAEEPDTQASLSETIGRVYLTLGLFDKARPHFDRAVAHHRKSGDEDQLGWSLNLMATLEDVRGDPETSLKLAEQATQMLRESGDEIRLATSLNTLGNALWHVGRLEEAETVHREGLTLRERLLDPDDTDIAQSLHNIGALRYFAGDLVEAERLWRRSADIEEAAYGPDDWKLATSLHTLAIVCKDQGRYDEALELESRSLAIREKTLGPRHPYVALSLTTLGEIYRLTGRAEDAVTETRRAIDIATDSWAHTHYDVLWMQRALVRALIEVGRLDQARLNLENTLVVVENDGDEGELPALLDLLGDLHRRAARLELAETACLRSMAIGERLEGPDDGSVALSRAVLAMVRRDQGRLDEAERMQREVLTAITAEWGPSDRDVVRVTRELAETLRRAGREAEADALESGLAVGS